MQNLPENIIRKIGNVVNNHSVTSLRSTSKNMRKLIIRRYAHTHFFNVEGKRVNKKTFENRLKNFKGDNVNTNEIRKFVKNQKLNFGDIIIHPALKSDVNKIAWNEMNIKYKIGLVNENHSIVYTNHSLWENFLIPKKFQKLGIKFFEKSPLARLNNYGFVNEYGNINVENGEKNKINKPDQFAKRFIQKTINNKALQINENTRIPIVRGGGKVTLPYRILTLRL